MNLTLITSRENLVDSLARMQSFFSVYREIKVPRADMLDVYKALVWVLDNFELDDGIKSYIRGNLNAVSSHSFDVKQLKSAIEETVNSYDKDAARGGEVEYALRSLMMAIREGRLKRKIVSERAMLTTLKDYLRGIIDAYNAVRFNIFVSYTSKDREVAGQLSEHLSHSSTKVKTLEIEQQIIGERLDWLLDEMYEGDTFLFLLSQHSAHLFKPSDKFAIKQGTSNRGVILFPVRIDDCEIPPALKDHEVLDIASDFEKGFDKLTRIIGLVSNVDLNAVDPHTFESLIIDLLSKEGFVQSTARPDAGIDLVVERNESTKPESGLKEITVVQVKRYPHSKADLMSLNQFASLLKSLSGIRKGLLVTNSSLTSAAKGWLGHLNNEGINISVIDGVELKELLLRHQDLIQKYFPDEKVTR
jgi:hypothetical protein